MKHDTRAVQMRYTKLCDAYYLKQWLSEPGILRWFPIFNQNELEDSVKRWIDFARLHCSLTATIDGNPCGLATLYLQPYRKLAHQCEFGIVVGKNYRNSGIGRLLIEQLMLLAKNRFKMELLHLQVYEGNPAIALYHRMQFIEFGRQAYWIKEEDGRYSARIFMERSLSDIPLVDPLPFAEEAKVEAPKVEEPKVAMPNAPPLIRNAHIVKSADLKKKNKYSQTR